MKCWRRRQLAHFASGCEKCSLCEGKVDPALELGRKKVSSTWQTKSSVSYLLPRMNLGVVFGVREEPKIRCVFVCIV